MATSKDFIAYILDQIGDESRTRVRAMFGEYALYYDNVVVALVCDSTVFLKINEHTTALLGKDYAKGPAYPNAKDWYILDAEIIENPHLFKEILMSCAEYLQIHKKNT
jgi:TfoX/Sxy family transcriptional regulator of competence genes